MLEVRILRMYNLKMIFMIFFVIFDLFSSVTAETCPSGLQCDYHEICCGDECCSDESYGYGYGYGFYNLWYFWFVIIMIMMTCCGACSYVKKRQLYMQQQQAMASGVGTTAPQAAGPGVSRNIYPPASYGTHPNMGTVGPPVGTFPSPPAYNEVTDKPDQYPKADYGYPNYAFAAAPPYTSSDPNAVPQTSAAVAPGLTPSFTPGLVTPGATAHSVPSPSAADTSLAPPAAPYPAVIVPSSEPSVAPPPYTPSPQEQAPAQMTPTDQSAVDV